MIIINQNIPHLAVFNSYPCAVYIFIASRSDTFIQLFIKSVSLFDAFLLVVSRLCTLHATCICGVALVIRIMIALGERLLISILCMEQLDILHGYIRTRVVCYLQTRSL